MRIISVILLTALIVALAALAVTLLLRRERKLTAEQRFADLQLASRRIVHTLKNPLQSILLQADLLRDGAVASSVEARAEISDAIAGEAERMATMLNDLAAFAQGDGGGLNLQAVPLLELLREIARCSSADAVRLLVEGEEAIVQADPFRLRQALDRLVANAREAVDARDRPEMSARVRARGSLVELKLIDNGSGIAAGESDRVFEPFATSSSAKMGLGLTIARAIIERHGGRIEVVPGQTEGATLRVVLPAAPEPPDRL